MRNLFIGLSLLLISCGNEVDHNGKTPLAVAGDKYLYKEDVVAVVPPALSAEDSVAFVKNYIKNWAEDVFFYKQAESNLSDESYIKEYVENYRHSLIVNEYQERLVREKFTAEISDKEVKDYYDSQKDAFLLDRSILKGVFVKVPLGNKELESVRRMMRFRHDDDRDKLERFTLRGATDYSYFREEWINLDELSLRLPSTASTSKIVDNGHLYEYKDSAYVYLLHVDSVIPEGGYMPYELAYKDIYEVIYNERKASYIKQVREELYDKAVDDNDIRLFN